jgi:glutamate/tyrosine decarboxylase-like PLP-dependent enzyme
MEGAGAVFAENEVLHWLAREFGMPEGSGGVFVQGGTIGNLSALVTARDAARRRNREAQRPDPARWIIVCSAEAHSSIASAAAVMDVDVETAEVDADGRLHGGAVTRVLDAHGDAVFAIVATGGTTNFGIVDDIAGVGAVARERGIWFHVDGAYGLAAMLVESMRPAFAGVELADSVIVDPHKWLFAPFDACALIYREPSLALSAHTQKAEYLDTLTGKPDWNPSDLAVQLTRRARGLPLWFSLATHGTEQYRAAIAHGIDLARRIADEIEARDGLSLVRDPQLSVVVFRREGWTLADYEAWSDRLLEEQHAFVVPSSHAGEPVLRFAIISPLTTFELLTGILDTLA